jgi:hypothetical protein
MKEILIYIKFGDRKVTIATNVPKKYRDNKELHKYLKHVLRMFYKSERVAYKAYGYEIVATSKGD